MATRGVPAGPPGGGAAWRQHQSAPRPDVIQVAGLFAMVAVACGIAIWLDALMDEWLGRPQRGAWRFASDDEHGAAAGGIVTSMRGVVYGRVGAASDDGSGTGCAVVDGLLALDSPAPDCCCGAVPQLRWVGASDADPGAEAAFLEAVLRNATPVVLTHTPADRWPARSHWKPELFSAAPLGDIQLQVFRGPPAGIGSPTFFSTYNDAALLVEGTHDADAPVPQLRSWRAAADVTVETMTLRRFWEAASPRHATTDNDGGEASADRVFLKAALPNFPTGWASEHVDPTPLQALVDVHLDESVDAHAANAGMKSSASTRDDSVASVEYDASSAPTFDPTLFDVWMGAPGVCSHTHYDLQHNLYTQLHGDKSFVLAPPAAHAALRPFPALHPRHRQVRDTLSHDIGGTMYDGCGEKQTQGAVGTAGTAPPAAGPAHAAGEKCDSLASPGGRGLVATVLSPGDVLYIPPMWMHSGKSLTASISFSSCSAAVEERVADIIERAPIPFEADWSCPRMAAALREYAEQVAEASGCTGSAMVAAAGGPDASFVDAIWATRYSHALDADVGAAPGAPCAAVVCGFSASEPGDLDVFVASRAVQSAVRRGVRGIAPYLRAVADVDARAILLANLVETWASFLLGGGASAVRFIGACGSGRHDSQTGLLLMHGGDNVEM